MRRYLIPVLLAALFLSPQAHAQETKLTVPSSPAFSILNYEPTAVMHPTSYKSLAADVLNSFDKDGKLLMNLGLEVSPYWLQSRPTLTRAKYLHPNPGQAFLQSFSLSAATVKDSASGDNRLGAGFRFKLINGRPVPLLSQAQSDLLKQTTVDATIAAIRPMIGSTVNTVQDAIDVISAALVKANASADVVTQFKFNAAALQKDFSDTPAGIKAFLEKMISDREAANKELAQRVATLLKQRLGFVLEFAGATAFNTTRNNDLEKAGAWINASDYISENDLFTFTARYMFQNQDTITNNFDAGLSYLRKSDRFNISLEAMVRWYNSQVAVFGPAGERLTKNTQDFTYRVAVQGSYILGKDISVNLSFGKNFDSPFASTSGFFSILGVNYSLFNLERVRL